MCFHSDNPPLSGSCCGSEFCALRQFTDLAKERSKTNYTFDVAILGGFLGEHVLQNQYNTQNQLNEALKILTQFGGGFIG